MSFFYMENTVNTDIEREGNSYIMNLKILIFAGLFTLLVIFSLWRSGIKDLGVSAQIPPVEKNEQRSENEMSAVKFTALPFILAFKHFIVENEK